MIPKTQSGNTIFITNYMGHPMVGSYDEKCDIWSCGVLAYFMLSGDLPFSAGTDGEIARKVKAGVFEFGKEFKEVSEHGKEFITEMLTMDPAARPSAEALSGNQWLDENVARPRADSTIAKDLGSRLKSFKAASKLKRVALTVIAKQMKDKDLDELKKTFEALDVHKKGTVNPAEMRKSMEEHGIDIPPDLDDLMRSCDSDGSGELDYTEFVAATMTTKQYRRKSVMWAAFRTFDTDGDGMITKTDLAGLLQEGVGSATVSSVFADEGAGDSISFEAFCNTLENDASTQGKTIVLDKCATTRRRTITFSDPSELSEALQGKDA